jgi:hypothetical protein
MHAEYPAHEMHAEPDEPHELNSVPVWHFPAVSQQPKQLDGPQGGSPHAVSSAAKPPTTTKKNRFE